ncbi:symmetrical bis(5'-nucleosyl)-tetraphosphatase [Colwelliaceae bacterium 6471]
MALYIVGDVQGCYQELVALMKQVNFNVDNDQLWLAGDIVARGPDSLATIRLIKSMDGNAQMVLGNHDLHLLATYEGIKKVKKHDYLDELLAAKDIDNLMDWLANQPLLRKIPKCNAYMSHAGVSPQWSIEDAVTQANNAHNKLSSSNRKKWLKNMYGEHPNSWSDAITEKEKFRYTINAFTRMRFCYADGSLEFKTKQAPESSLKKLTPWYELSDVINHSVWIFGHWAALMGQSSHPNIYALDTGCVWGNHLTMLRWEDKQFFIEPAHNKL